MGIARELEILRRAGPGAVAALTVAFAFGLYTFTCLIGAGVLAYAFERFVQMLLVAARGEPLERQVRWTGVVASLAVVVHVLLVTFVVVIVYYATDPMSPWLTFVLEASVALAASSALGVALAPLAFTAFALGDGETSLGRGLSRSFEIAARLGPRRLARVGAGAGLRLAIGAVLTSALSFVMSFDDPRGGVLLSIPAGIALAIPFAGAQLAREYASVEAHARPLGGAVPRLRAIALLLVPGAVLCAVALTTTAVTPTPMGLPDDACIRGLHWASEPLPLPGTSVTVYPTRSGVRVEAADGGGAGNIDAFWPGRIAVSPGERCGGPANSYAVLAGFQDIVSITIVDRDGVRLDDGLDNRVLDRLGTSGLALLALSIALLVILALVLARRIGAARTLDAPSLLEASAKPPLAALEGVLRTSGRMFFTSAGALVAEHDAWLEADGGALRLRLAPEVSVIGALVAPSDGDAIVLVSRFDKPLTAGTREASAPWPEDGRLVIGTRADAAEALVARAARTATWLAVPALASMIAAAVLVLARL